MTALKLESSHQTYSTYTNVECTVENSWWWAEELPETFRVSWKNKFEKSVRLLGLLNRNLLRCTFTWTLKKFGTFVNQAKRSSLFYGRFEVPRHKFHCKSPFKKSLVKGKKGLLQRSVSRKTCEQLTKGNKMCLADPWKAWETRSIYKGTYNERQQHNKQTFHPTRNIK